MKLILEALVTGILTGGVYALMASGLTLVYGVMEVVNIAQGIFVVAGAYLSYTLQQHLHLDLFLGLLVTVPIMFILGLFIEWAVLRRLKRDRIVLSVLVTFAITLIIEGLLGLVYGASLVYLHAWYISTSFQIFGFYISYIYVFAFLLSMLLLGALYLLVYRTKFGFSLRASMQDRAAALLIGINVEQVQAITFGIGIALAAAGGMAFGATNIFNASSASDLITRLLVVIVLGGMGSLWGALIASLLMLVIGDIAAVVWSPIWSSTLFFALLIVLLVARPQGLFGQREGRKL